MGVDTTFWQSFSVEGLKVAMETLQVAFFGLKVMTGLLGIYCTQRPRMWTRCKCLRGG